MKYKLYWALVFVIGLVFELAFASLYAIAAAISSAVMILRTSWAILVGNQDPQLVCGVMTGLIKLLWKTAKDVWTVGILHLDNGYVERIHKEMDDIVFLK